MLWILLAVSCIAVIACAILAVVWLTRKPAPDTTFDSMINEWAEVFEKRGLVGIAPILRNYREIAPGEARRRLDDVVKDWKDMPRYIRGPFLRIMEQGIEPALADNTVRPQIESIIMMRSEFMLCPDPRPQPKTAKVRNQPVDLEPDHTRMRATENMQYEQQGTVKQRMIPDQPIHELTDAELDEVAEQDPSKARKVAQKVRQRRGQVRG